MFSMQHHLYMEVSSINPEQQGKVKHLVYSKHRAFKENTTFVNIRELSRGPSWDNTAAATGTASSTICFLEVLLIRNLSQPPQAQH